MIATIISTIDEAITDREASVAAALIEIARLQDARVALMGVESIIPATIAPEPPTTPREAVGEPVEAATPPEPQEGAVEPVEAVEVVTEPVKAPPPIVAPDAPQPDAEGKFDLKAVTAFIDTCGRSATGAPSIEEMMAEEGSVEERVNAKLRIFAASLRAEIELSDVQRHQIRRLKVESNLGDREIASKLGLDVATVSENQHDEWGWRTNFEELRNGQRDLRSDPFLPYELDAIRASPLDQGMLAWECYTSRATIGNIINRQGIYYEFTQDDAVEARGMIAKGMSRKEVAAAFKISQKILNDGLYRFPEAKR